MVTEILEKLVAEFPDGAPDEQEVRAHRVSFYPRHWLSGDRWPEYLQHPAVLAEEGRVAVSRQELFEAARSVQSAEDAVAFYVQVAGWGVGTQARGVARVAKPLQDPAVGDKLLEAYKLARAGDPVQAYTAMNHGGRFKVKHLGAAFFTKWLYFSGYETALSRNRTPALILDQRVAQALGWSASDWSAEEYQHYLDIAQDIAASWCPSGSLHVVEFGLFRVGRRRSSAAAS